MGHGIKMWVGTGLDEERVELFLDRRPTDFRLGAGLGHWAEDGQPILRTQAKLAFPKLPRHGDREVFEYSIFGDEGKRLA